MPAVATRSRFVALAFAVSALAVQAEGVSAPAAQAALAQGTVAWDVRSAPAVLIAGAAQARAGDLQRWLDGDGTEWLERAVSAAGIDLSRGVVLYGAAGDPRAQVLHERLARLASGPVHWLVGGIDEWQAAGLPTSSEPVRRMPVPQRLARAPGTVAPEMAGSALRRSEPAAATSIATAPRV